MKIDLHQITIRDVLKGYKDNNEMGVVAYDGKLNVRPEYQREFIYKDKQRNAVIESIKKVFPLNIMYWVVREDGKYEVLDGQQRTISIGQYINGDFSLNEKYFHNLTIEEKNQILDYKLMIYFCKGTDREKLEWFTIINISGEKLTHQEILNAVYSGQWLFDAKLKFSKTNCVAYRLANDEGQLIKGSPIRQEYLETVLRWISNDDIENYMAKHQHDTNADELWVYFQNVIDWIRQTFSYRRQMSDVNWGELYNQFKNENFDKDKLEAQIKELMVDEDIDKKSGIYKYLLTRNEKYLNLRAFPQNIKTETYEKQNGICPFCKPEKKYDISKMHADHIKPWRDGGKTNKNNCQMLCIQHNLIKSGK
jgi:hypothetical protein